MGQKMNEQLPKFKGEKLLAEIAKSTDGLTYISETDAAIEPIFVDSSETERFHDSITENKKSETVEPSVFFHRLTTKKDWFGPNEIERAEKFAVLEEILRANLTDLKVVRVGRIRIDIYVVGLDGDGNLIGIKTKAVET
jgi:hypothetical protein